MPPFEMNEIDQENSPQEQGLSSHVQFGGERNTEVVRFGECFFEYAAPLFRDFPDLPAGYLDYERPGVQNRTEELKDLIS